MLVTLCCHAAEMRVAHWVRSAVTLIGMVIAGSVDRARYGRPGMHLRLTR
jgi:hypothetical protein